MRSIPSACLLVATALPLSAQSLHVVDRFGPGDFATLQEAVDAAQSGDTLLVVPYPSNPSSYPGFRSDGKALTITSSTQDRVKVASSEILNVPAGGSFLCNKLQGFDIDASEPTLRIANCEGPVTLQDSTFRASLLVSQPFELNAVEVSSSAQVVIDGCELVGSNSVLSLGQVEPAGIALACESSNLFVYGTQLQGGTGAQGANHPPTSSPWPAGPGAPALSAQDSNVLLEQCIVQGGHGGPGYWSSISPACSSGGNGASAANISGGLLRHRECTFVPGSGGFAGSTCTPGLDAPALQGLPQELVALSGTSATYAWSPNPIREFEPGLATHGGLPGASVFVLVGFAPLAAYSDVHASALLVAPPISVVPALPLSPQGSGSFPVGLGELGPGIESISLTIQIVTFDPNEGFRLGSRQIVTILDSSL